MTHITTPFSLGYEGERWNTPLGCLVVPVPGTDRCLLIQQKDGGYYLITQDKWRRYDNLLMLTAVLQDFIDNYVTIGGNLYGQDETNTEA